MIMIITRKRICTVNGYQNSYFADVCLNVLTRGEAEVDTTQYAQNASLGTRWQQDFMYMSVIFNFPNVTVFRTSAQNYKCKSIYALL